MRIVLLKGRERFLHLEHTALLRKALRERFGEIETFEFDGRTAKPADVLDELRSYGLMQQHKLVIVDRADKLIAAPEPEVPSQAGGDGDALAPVDDDVEEAIDDEIAYDGDEDDESDDMFAAGSDGGFPPRKLMERYAENPVEDATLLLRAEGWRPGNLDKLIKKVGGIIACEAIKPEKAAIWCGQRCRKRYDADIAPSAAAMLVERIGVHLDRLDQELCKLATYVGSGQMITADHVSTMTSLTSEEAGWVIQEAILSGDAGHALTKLGELMHIGRVDYEPLAWSMMDLSRKCHAAVNMLRQGVPAGVVTKELRLWGPARDAVLRIGRSRTPAAMADLFEQAMRSDERTKSGFGNKHRTLEATALLLADTLKSGT